jgi:spoIIIJ-associated protein
MSDSMNESTVDVGPSQNGRGSVELLVKEGDLAADYIERLLDITDTDGDIDLDVESGRAMVAVVGDHLKSLIGPKGATLDALQELTRIAVSQQTGERSRLMLDVGGYRDRRREELVGIAEHAIERFRSTGVTVSLDPMNAFERKIVHDVVTSTDGVRSESEGEDPERYVVVYGE